MFLRYAKQAHFHGLKESQDCLDHFEIFGEFPEDNAKIKADDQ